MKKCPKCGEIKAESEFHKNNRSKDGLYYCCKQCNSNYYAEHKKERIEYQHQYYSAHKEQELQRSAEYRSKHKEAKKKRDAKYRIEHKNERKEYYYTNRDEILERQKRNYRENKDKILERHKQYYQQHKEYYKEYNSNYRQTEQGKAVKSASRQKRRTAKVNNGGSFSADEWFAVCTEFDNKCAYCGKEDKLTADHIIPVSKGGTSNVNNIVPACQSCNSSKHTNELEEWYRRQPFFMPERFEKIIEHSK